MTEADLVPLQMHNALTAGQAPWTDTRVPAQVWHVARAVYGTADLADEQRLYRTIQAVLMTLVPADPVAWLSSNGVKAMTADEKNAWLAAGRADLVDGYSTPLRR